MTCRELLTSRTARLSAGAISVTQQINSTVALVLMSIRNAARPSCVTLTVSSAALIAREFSCETGAEFYPLKRHRDDRFASIVDEAAKKALTGNTT